MTIGHGAAHYHRGGKSVVHKVNLNTGCNSKQGDILPLPGAKYPLVYY
jgi:hypothetical protein